MFFVVFLFAFSYSADFCVETTSGDCAKMCSGITFTETFDHFPTNAEVNALSNEASNTVYFADDIEFPTNNDFNFKTQACDDSVSFILTSSQIRISSSYEKCLSLNNAEIKNIKSPKILIKVSYNFTLDLWQANGLANSLNIVLEVTEPNIFMEHRILPDTADDDFKISISSNSKPFNVWHIDDRIKAFFSSTDKIKEIEKKYYCISDKTEKCASYQSNNPTVIESPSNAIGDFTVIIVESAIPQTFSSLTNNYKYMEIIGLENTQILFRQYYTRDEYYLILEDNSIITTHCCFEGKGKFILQVPNRGIIFFNNAVTNNNNFFIRTQLPEDNEYNRVFFVDWCGEIKIPSNKIKVPDHFVLSGYDNLRFAFEDGKYIGYNRYVVRHDPDKVNLINLKNYEYLINGDYNVPTTWNVESIFDLSSNAINFQNVHSYDDLRDSSIHPLKLIDDIFDISICSQVNIEPSKLFEFRIKSNEKNVKITINNDIILSLREDSSELSDETKKCVFSGNGKIMIDSENGIEKLQQVCTFEEGVTLEQLSGNVPDYYICIGKSNLAECQNEISDYDPDSGVEWIWMSSYFHYSELKKLILKRFI